jgi:iron complex transport system ATP-binding protein
MITLSHVSASYCSETVLDDLSLHITCGERVAMVGPNGAGKSSLLRVITGLLPAKGMVQVAGTDIQCLTPRDRARLLSVVPQDIANDIPYRARDFVLLGRTASLPRFGGPSLEDLQAVEEAMMLTETWELRHRALPEMSGGERQRLALAMALAARPKILLLDEPTSHLDLRNRAEIMHLLTKLNREQHTTILMVVHDLTLASQYFDRIILLNQGRKIADGSVAEVMDAGILETAYNCPILVFPLPGTSARCVVPGV